MKASFIFAMLLLSGAAVGCSSLEGEKDAKADAKRQVIDKEIEADRFASMLKNVQFIDGKAWTHFAFPINADPAPVEYFCSKSGFRLPSKLEVDEMKDEHFKKNFVGDIVTSDGALPKSVFGGFCVRD